MAERSEKLEAEFEMTRSLVWPQPAGALLQGKSRSRRVCEQVAVRDLQRRCRGRVRPQSSWLVGPVLADLGPGGGGSGTGCRRRLLLGPMKTWLCWFSR